MKSILKWANNHKRTSVTLIVLVTLVFIGLGLSAKFKEIKRVPLKIGDLSSSVYGSGQLKTDRSFDLKLGTTAKIIEVKKSIGTKVRKGETLVVFDNLPSFVSPLNGVITAINFKNGETAFAQSTVLSIVDPRDFYLEMSLDQKSVRFIREGQPVRISFDGYRDLKIDGDVRSAFSNNGLFYAIVDLKGVDPSFLPGMSADMAIIIETKKDVLLAPWGALRDGKILIEKNSRPKEISVATGISDGNFVEIQGTDLKAGDLAVIRSSLPQPLKFKGQGGE